MYFALLHLKFLKMLVETLNCSTLIYFGSCYCHKYMYLTFLCVFSRDNKKGLVSKMYNKIVVNYFILTEFTKVVRDELFQVNCTTQNFAFCTFTSSVLYWHQSGGQNVCGSQAPYMGRTSQHFTEPPQIPNTFITGTLYGNLGY